MTKFLSRRQMFSRTARAAGVLGLGLPLVEGAAQAQAAGAAKSKLKVVIAGAHPGDPEAGCGGIAVRYSDLGHDVANIYLTRGEAGVRGKSHAEAAAIRTAEAERACEILKARLVFAGQMDGATEINAGRYRDFSKILEAEAPDIVFTHWPLDSHRDHRVIPLLVYDVWLASGKRFPLYYFEVGSGAETSHFWPTHYVDITATEARKRAACYAHASQNPDEFYGEYHDAMNRFRGLECGRKFAEAFIRHVQSPDESLPLAL
jgi:LmbE family N-acetylglucosaminyl deacetylase